MTHLSALIAETASIMQDCERAEQRMRRRGEPVPTTTGNPWRKLAACKLELEVLQGKAALADQIARAGMSAGEFMEKWESLEARAKGLVTNATG